MALMRRREGGGRFSREEGEQRMELKRGSDKHKSQFKGWGNKI